MTTDTSDLLLDHYHCTFFLPLFDLEASDFRPLDRLRYVYPAEKEAQTKTEEAEAQAWHYFNPMLRDILYDRGESDGSGSTLQPVREWRLPEKAIKGWTLELGRPENRSNPLQYQIAEVEAVTLYRYFNGIYILAWRVMPRALQKLRQEQEALRKDFIREAAQQREVDIGIFDSPPCRLTTDQRMKREKIEQDVGRRLGREGLLLFRWDTPATVSEAMAQVPERHRQYYREMRLENWLHFTRLARVLFPSFPEQNQENKIQPLNLCDGNGCVLERAFHACMPIRRPESSGDILSPIVKYLLEQFVDPEKHALDDYWREKFAVYDDRLFVSVAYSLANDALPQKVVRRAYSLGLYVDREEDAFDRLGGHVYTPTALYERMEKQTLWLWQGMGGYYGYTDIANVYFYAGAFFREIIAPNHIPYIYDRMLIQALFYQATLRRYDAVMSRDTEDLKIERERFVQFTNRYWFHRLTEQMQGKEIFRLQQQALELEHDYKIIRDELERADELLRLQEAENQERLSTSLSFWGGIIAVLGAWYTLLGMWYDWWGQWSVSDRSLDSWLGFLLTVIIIPAILATGWWCWIRRKNRKAHNPSP